MDGLGRLNAYVLMADPSFLRTSILAYYQWVDRIVLSYDQSGVSWTGTPLPIDRCLEIVKALDVEGKCVEAPGHFSFEATHPMEKDTAQRQAALSAASDGADWVLQLDTDEVMLNPTRFRQALLDANAAGADALDYPSRWLYSRVRPGLYLERCNRTWRPAASYPGPLAVRAGTTLDHARQTKAPIYRLDFAKHNTDPWRPRDIPVQGTVALADAVAHFSWVRTPEVLSRKLRWSGHAPALDAVGDFELWVNRTRHPWRAVASSPLRRGDWLRLSRIPEPPGGDPAMES